MDRHKRGIAALDSYADNRGNRRNSSRVTLLIRPGKLIADGREFLCIVRDISEGGVKIRLFHPLPECRALHIEFDNGERHALQLVWQSGDMVGGSFGEDIDVKRLIAAQAGSYPRRQPRLRVEHAAMLYSGALRTPITLHDISPQGASIECSGWLMIDELVRIESAALPKLYAKVRWRRSSNYGLVFEQTFGLEELAQVCAGLANSVAEGEVVIPK